MTKCIIKLHVQQGHLNETCLSRYTDIIYIVILPFIYEYHSPYSSPNVDQYLENEYMLLKILFGIYFVV